MGLIRWTPAPNRNLVNFRDEMDRLLEGFFSHDAVPPAAARTWLPPVDIVESAENFVLRLDLPGMTQKDVKVNLVGDTLTLRGERKREAASTPNGMHRTERVFGTFERSFRLATPVRSEGVKATYRDGVLEVLVPKAEEARVREIEVQVG